MDEEYIILDNCTYYHFDSAYYKQKKKEMDEWTIKTAEELLIGMTDKQKAKKLGMSRDKYLELKRRYL